MIMSTVMFAHCAYHPTGSTSVHSGDLLQVGKGLFLFLLHDVGRKVVAVVVAVGVGAATNSLLGYFLFCVCNLLALCSLKMTTRKGKQTTGSSREVLASAN